MLSFKAVVQTLFKHLWSKQSQRKRNIKGPTEIYIFKWNNENKNKCLCKTLFIYLFIQRNVLKTKQKSVVPHKYFWVHFLSRFQINVFLIKIIEVTLILNTWDILSNILCTDPLLHHAVHSTSWPTTPYCYQDDHHINHVVMDTWRQWRELH